MIVVNTDSIPGQEIRVISLVKGATVQSKNAFKDIGAGFKNMVGGELKSYTQMMEEARGIATDRMVTEAHNLGADAIVAVRYSSSQIMAGAAEILVYGTAVKFV